MFHLNPEQWTLEEELDGRRWGRWHLAAGCPPAIRNYVGKPGACNSVQVCIEVCAYSLAASAAGL